VVNKIGASALILFVVLISQPAPGQTPAPAAGKPIAPGLIKLTGEDEKRANELDGQIDKAMKDDRWDEAIARAVELLALRMRAQGPKHFETVDAEWWLKTLRRVAAMPQDDRLAYQSARAMRAQAETLYAAGRYAQAQPLYEKVLEIHLRLLTDDHRYTADSYDNLASDLDEQGRYAQAQPLYEKALEIRRRLLTDDHPRTAASYNNLAYVLDAQGKYAQAQPLYEKALEIYRRLLTDDHPDTAASYNNVAGNFLDQGKYAQAQVLFEKALLINRRLLTDDHRATAVSYNNVAYCLDKQGKYVQAQPLFEKALEIHRRLLTDDHPATALSYNNVASNLDNQGKCAAAQPLFEKALEIRRRLLTDDHPDTASSFNNVANNLGGQGKYAQAQPLFEKALEINRHLLTDDHPGTAKSYNNVAFNLNAQGKYAAAQPLYEKALEIRRRLLGDDNPDTADSYNNVAYNLADQGRYTQAQALYEKALEIRRRLLTDDHRDTAASYNNLARVLNAQGRYAQAQPFYEKSLEIRRRLLTDEHPATALACYNLASNLYAQGKYIEARSHWVRAVKGLEAARLRFAFTGLERAAAGNSARPALAAVLARLGQPSEAWAALEADLGRGLLDELAARQDRRLSRIERAQLRELTNKLEELDKLVDSMPKELDKSERAKRFEDLKRQRDLASIALGEFHTKLVRDHGTLAGQVARLDQIQASLPADAALLTWIDIGPAGPNEADPDGEHWGVVVRSRGTPEWVPIAGTGADGVWSSDDYGLSSQVRKQVRSRPGNGSGDMRPLIEKFRAQRLDPLTKVLGATPDGLPPARRLIILPCRAIAGIPVEVLLAQGDIRTVSYAPSATVFKYLREQPRPDRHAGLLAVGDPVFERKLAQVLVAARSGDEELAPLPGTRYEVEAIAQLFKSDDRPAKALLGADASEPELDRLAASGELGRFGFIHLATHGVIDEAIPQRSAVILTQTGLPDPLEQVVNHKPVFDGRLVVREIQRSWDLKAELVTLSACETALGRDAGGEGFLGFTQALLMSGARSVCLSLWQVDDKATSLLMTRFYQNLLGKRPALSKPMPKAEALHEAKQWLRSLTVDEIDGELAALSRGDVRPLAKVDGTTSPGATPSPESNGGRPYDHPYFWAAFVLAGDPD